MPDFFCTYCNKQAPVVACRTCSNRACLSGECPSTGRADISQRHTENFRCTDCTQRDSETLQSELQVDGRCPDCLVHAFYVPKKGSRDPPTGVEEVVTAAVRAFQAHGSDDKVRRQGQLLESHYHVDKSHQLFLATSEMGDSRWHNDNASWAVKMRASISKFLGVGTRGNYLAVVQTHCDDKTGELVIGRSEDYILPVHELLRRFMSTEIWSRLPALSGMKGLLLMTCGAALTNPLHRQCVIELVTSNRFNFAIGFTASRVDGVTINTAFTPLVSALTARYPDTRKSFWTHLAAEAIPREVFKKTSVVFVFKTHAGDLVVREVFDASVGIWGCYDPIRCPALDCEGELTVRRRSRKQGLLLKCRSCSRTSTYLQVPVDMKEFDRATHLYSRPYPPLLTMQDYVWQAWVLGDDNGVALSRDAQNFRRKFRAQVKR
ncbi:hypothetical protein BC629DRAFT_1567431 [Irpex lacteus]|nr:hypothetical protein BC629DRAFT_1567431 [Irpex lacteus]